MTTTKIWECKIGEVDSVAGGSDYPMRQAVAAAYKAITGVEPVFIFSGWGASLTEYERAVVENRLPAPATAPDELERLRILAELMKEGLDAVEVLIDNSNGVAGLHQNGDIASWSELRTGGRFEAWLLAFDDAREAAMKGTP